MSTVLIGFGKYMEEDRYVENRAYRNGKLAFFDEWPDACKEHSTQWFRTLPPFVHQGCAGSGDETESLYHYMGAFALVLKSGDRTVCDYYEQSMLCNIDGLLNTDRIKSYMVSSDFAPLCHMCCEEGVHATGWCSWTKSERIALNND